MTLTDLLLSRDDDDDDDDEDDDDDDALVSLKLSLFAVVISQAGMTLVYHSACA